MRSARVELESGGGLSGHLLILAVHGQVPRPIVPTKNAGQLPQPRFLERARIRLQKKPL
jgi:hypothetical protein